MRKLIYDPAKSGKQMRIVCFVSGSGTNYREIVARDPSHDYLLFTNRPDCGGVAIATQLGHKVIKISHIPYLKAAAQKYGTGKTPRNYPERLQYEEDVVTAIEKELGRSPDLICLAGYDQWTTDWLVDRYYPHILNVHPGDTTRGYNGLHWIPSAKSILAGDLDLRSTVFFVDKGEDTGPVLLQSAPLNIVSTLKRLEVGGDKGLIEALNRINAFTAAHKIKTYPEFIDQSEPSLYNTLEHLSHKLQEELKVFGDWEIYPYAVHDIIAAGRAAIENRKVYIDNNLMPEYGMRLSGPSR